MPPGGDADAGGHRPAVLMLHRPPFIVQVMHAIARGDDFARWLHIPMVERTPVKAGTDVIRLIACHRLTSTAWDQRVVRVDGGEIKQYSIAAAHEVHRHVIM